MAEGRIVYTILPLIIFFLCLSLIRSPVGKIRSPAGKIRCPAGHSPNAAGC